MWPGFSSGNTHKKKQRIISACITEQQGFITFDLSSPIFYETFKKALLHHLFTCAAEKNWEYLLWCPSDQQRTAYLTPPNMQEGLFRQSFLKVVSRKSWKLWWRRRKEPLYQSVWRSVIVRKRSSFFVRKSFVKKGFQSLRLKWLIFICGFCAHYSLQGTLVPFFPFLVGIKGIKESSPGRRFYNITKYNTRYFLFERSIALEILYCVLRKMRFISIVFSLLTRIDNILIISQTFRNRIIFL